MAGRYPKNMDTNEIFQEVESGVILPSAGTIQDVRDAVDSLKLDVAAEKINNDYNDALAMAEEVLTVMLHEDSDPNAENPVQVSCNGVNQFFLRGQQQEVKRKYVEILARAKRTRISTPEITDASGARANALRQASSLRYPFQVVYDPNPKGPAWLKQIMMEAA